MSSSMTATAKSARNWSGYRRREDCCALGQLPDISVAERRRCVLDRVFCDGGSALNFDFLFSEDGKFYFLELGPRNGGCLIPEVIRYATGVDLIKATVDAALGLDCSYIQQVPIKGFWSSYMVHSLKTGFFKQLNISERAQKMIVEKSIYVVENDPVKKYSGSHDTLGMMILKYPNKDTMLDMIDNMERDIFVFVN